VKRCLSSCLSSLRGMGSMERFCRGSKAFSGKVPLRPPSRVPCRRPSLSAVQPGLLLYLSCPCSKCWRGSTAWKGVRQLCPRPVTLTRACCTWWPLTSAAPPPPPPHSNCSSRRKQQACCLTRMHPP
jgi:hypothetical protein